LDRKAEAKASGEQYSPKKPPEDDWVPVSVKPFLTQPEEYVICLNTMGQDRKFTDDELRFALETI
jgi:hypothetical protein